MPAPKGKKAARPASRPARTRASKSVKTKKKSAAPRRASAPAAKAKKSSPAKASKSPKPKSGKSSSASLAGKGKKPARPASRPAAPKSGAKPAPKTTVKTSAKAKAAPAAPVRKGPAPAAAAPAKRPAPLPAPPAAKAAPKALPGRPAAAPRPAAAKPSRRSRPRIEAESTPHAAWFPQPGSGRMPASFIPAPPRAEAPSNVAAPPATADRIVRPSDMAVDSSVRHHPVRIDIEYSAGRTVMIMHPEELTIRPGEGIEWDFRYTGGADLMVEEILIEFPKPSPFGKPSIRAKKPSSQRHRQLSGPAADATVRLEYIIRAINAFKTEVALARPRLVIQP